MATAGTSGQEVTPMSVEVQEWPWRDAHGDYALVPVPAEKRRTLLNIFLVYTGVLACIAALWGGGTLGVHFSLRELIITAVAGSAILSVVGGLIAPIGAASASSTYAIMRLPFGKVGSGLWGLVVSGIPCGIGWFAVETWLFGVMLHEIAPGHWWSDVTVASIWGGLLMMTTAVVGYSGLAFLSFLTVPMWICLAVASFLLGVEHGGGLAGLLTAVPKEPWSLAQGITATVGLYVAGAVITSDVGRYARKPWHAGVAWVVQLMVLMVLFLVGAGAMTLAMGGPRITEALLWGGISTGAYIMAIFGQWTTNDNNLYSGALCWSTFLPVRKRLITVLEGIVGTAIAAWIAYTAGGSLGPFERFLGWLGVFVPPVGGVIIADFYIYRWYKRVPFSQRYSFRPGMDVPLVNWVGWVSALAGGLVGRFYQAGIPALNALVVGFVLYSVLAILCDSLRIPLHVGTSKLTETGQ